MNNLLTLSYWFNPNPGVWLAGVLPVIYSVFALLFLLGLVASIFKKKNQKDSLMLKFWSKVQGLGLTIGFLGMILVFARQEMVVGIAMPFLFLLVVVWGAVWLVFIIKFITKTVPQRREEQRQRREKEKYLLGKK